MERYGKYKAKINFNDISGDLNGKLILVTAINPTPAGEGKTTTTIGLADALTSLGKKMVVAMREPSLGPVFGVKGGATGGKGGVELAEEVIRLCEQKSDFRFAYDEKLPIKDKIKEIVTKIYGGKDVAFMPSAVREVKELTELGFDKTPVCIAKTQYFFSDNPALLGAPKDFTVTVKR